MASNGFGDVAGTASEPLIKAWVAAGGKVLATSKSVPIKNVIVSSASGKAAIDTIRTYFTGLSASAEGQTKLTRIGREQGFVAYDPAAYVALGSWMGL